MNRLDRVNAYNQTFPKWKASHLREVDGWVEGMWVLGNNYKGSGYHGSYPPGYLKRIIALFPDAKHESTLQLFSGSLGPDTFGLRFDRREDVNPDFVGEADQLGSYFLDRRFDLIIADPPYTEEDANKYGTCLISRKKVFQQCRKILNKGGNLVWMDQILPMYRKDEWDLWGLIGLVRSTNHRFRVVSIFEKV